MPSRKNFSKNSGFSFLEVVVAMFLFSLAFTAFMEALQNFSTVNTGLEKGDARLQLADRIMVELRSGAGLFNYGFKQREKDRLRQLFEQQNPGAEFFFNGRLAALGLSSQGSFRHLEDHTVRHAGAEYTVSIHRRILQAEPFLIRYRVSVADKKALKEGSADENSGRVELAGTVSWYLTPFYN